MNITFTDRLKSRYPESSIGILLLNNINNTDEVNILDNVKKEFEGEIRNKYSELSRDEIMKDETFSAYREYYKKFKKTYHLLLQLESIAKKGKSFPDVNPLVDSCFLAEMNTFVLTAAHDADLLDNHIVFDVSSENDNFTQINGREIILKPDDIIMKSSNKNVCSIIYGQDSSTAIRLDTVNALYVSYAPDGVKEDNVYCNLTYIQNLIVHISPMAETVLLNVFKLGSLQN